MTQPSATPPKADWKSKLLVRLHDPIQFRTCVTGVVLVAGYFLIYTPLSGQIEETTDKLAKEQKLLELGRNIEHLRSQFQAFDKRLPKQTDSKEWVEYMLNGIRKFPLKLAGLDCEATRNMGPYKVVVLRIELEGSFHDMDRFLRWLDSNERLFRVDSLRVSPSRSCKQVLIMQMTVLGVMG